MIKVFVKRIYQIIKHWSGNIPDCLTDCFYFSRYSCMSVTYQIKCGCGLELWTCTCIWIDSPACGQKWEGRSRISKALQKQTERRRMTFTLFGGFLYDFYQGLYLSIPLFLVCLWPSSVFVYSNVKLIRISFIFLFFTSAVSALTFPFVHCHCLYLNVMGKSWKGKFGFLTLHQDLVLCAAANTTTHSIYSLQ